MCESAHLNAFCASCMRTSPLAPFQRPPMASNQRKTQKRYPYLTLINRYNKVARGRRRHLRRMIRGFLGTGTCHSELSAWRALASVRMYGTQRSFCCALCAQRGPDTKFGSRAKLSRQRQRECHQYQQLRSKKRNARKNFLRCSKDCQSIAYRTSDLKRDAGGIRDIFRSGSARGSGFRLRISTKAQIN